MSNKLGVKIGVVTAAAAALASTSVVSAFVQPAFHVGVGKSGLRMVDGGDDTSANDEVAALRAAAAKFREESNRLAKELGKEVPEERTKTNTATATTTTTTTTPRDAATILASLKSAEIDFAAGDASSQSSALDDLVSRGELSLWKSAARGAGGNINEGNNALRTYPVTVNALESRSGGAVTAESLGIGTDSGDDVTLDDLKDATIVVAGGSFALAVASLALLPENVGAGLSYLFALLPVLYLGIGSTSPGLIAGAINAFRGLGESDDDREAAFDRVCRHEAGHFLCGWLCGLPVRSYEVDDGEPRVEFHPNANNEDRELTREEIAALSVVALSGSVAEAVGLGQAKGGRNDLIELDGLFRRSKEFMGAAAQQNMTRWGALAAFSLIKANNDRYERLVRAFKDNKSVAECVAIMEATS